MHFQQSSTLPEGHFSLNTVLVSQKSGSIRMGDGVTSLTLTHEIGHSFGASHDEDFPERSECLPGDDSKYGKYVMSATVSSHQRRAHNWMFSICSREAMQPIVVNKGRICLQPRSEPFCGNSWVEHGEQCDCGTTQTCEVHDKCCAPVALHPYYSPTQGCKLKKSSQCSPRVQLCCTEDCGRAEPGTICREMTECMSFSLCSGRSPSCPAPKVVPDGMPCAGLLGRCQDGMCSVTVCQQAGLVDCRCLRPRNHACSVCCRCQSAPEEACVPAQWLNVAMEPSSLLLPPGTQCLDSGHTCDNDARCVRSKD